MNKNEIYRSIIISNSMNPNHLVDKNFSDPSFKKILTKSSTCADNYEIFLKVENNLIKDIVFTGYGCSISKSATNLLCEYLKDKNMEEAKMLLNSFRKMVKKEETPSLVLLKDLIAYENVANHLNRVSCALLSANALIEALEKYHE